MFYFNSQQERIEFVFQQYVNGNNSRVEIELKNLHLKTERRWLFEKTYLFCRGNYDFIESFKLKYFDFYIGVR